MEGACTETSTSSTIDKEMQDLMDKQKNKWRKILHSLVEVIKYLRKQNFPLRSIVPFARWLRN